MEENLKIRALMADAIDYGGSQGVPSRRALEQRAQRNGHFLNRYRERMLAWVVNSAVEAAHADMGNIQLVDSASGELRIAAQLGFERPFLKFFDSVHNGQAACGTALGTGQLVMVEDVTDSPIFYGTEALEAVLDAGVRSVQSMPLIGTSGKLVGVLSVHHRSAGQMDARDVTRLKVLAARTAEWIERHKRKRTAAGLDGGIVEYHPSRNATSGSMRLAERAGR